MWGKNLARNFHDLNALKVICDVSKPLLAEAGKLYPGVDTSDSIDAVMERKDIQGIVIASPPAEHMRLAVRAMEAGKDVLVEKPLALSEADGRKIQETAQKFEKILLVGHVLEYHPAILKLRELLEVEALGKLRYLYSHRLNLGRIRADENALWSFAPHDVAIALRLMKGAPESVTCTGGSYLNSKIADTTITVMNFPNGVQSHIFVSWLHPFKVQRFVIIGDRQMAVFDDTLPWTKKLLLYPYQVDLTDGQVPVARKAEGIAVPLVKKEPLLAECEHFLKCVATRQKPLTDGECGVQVLRVLEAAQQSMQQGGKAVSMEINRKFFIHPTAVVDVAAVIGEGTKIWHFAHVMAGAKIGKNCILGQNVYMARNVILGDGVKIQNNVSLYEGVTLEDYVFCGPSMVFTNVINPRSEISRKNEFKPTLVKRGASLGANCTLICGVTVGRYAFVGAGATVTKDVPDYALVVGTPAKITGWICECGQKLSFSTGDAICGACKKFYRKTHESHVEKKA